MGGTVPVPRLTPHQQEPRHRRELPSGTNVEQQEAASGKACGPRITVETLLGVEVPTLSVEALRQWYDCAVLVHRSSRFALTSAEHKAPTKTL